jgi:hypothetical protein
MNCGPTFMTIVAQRSGTLLPDIQAMQTLSCVAVPYDLLYN